MPQNPLKTILESDEKLKFSSPEERDVRLKYPFSNIFITFPTTEDEGVSFPAYIKSLQDTFNPSFQSVAVYGRMDDIPVYQGTKRQISLTIGMPSFNLDDAKVNLKNINTIVRNLYPSYTSVGSRETQVVNSPPLMRIKFANLIYNPFLPGTGLLGYVNGAVQINHDAATKGLFVETNEGGDGLLIVKAYELSLSLTVLHEGYLGFSEAGRFMVGQFPYSFQGSGVNFLQNDSEGTPDAKAKTGTGAPVSGQGKGVADKNDVAASKVLGTK